MDGRAECARRAAAAGADVALDSFRTDHEVETKAWETDVVTRADRDAQARVVDAIRERYPDDEIVGEEDAETGAVPTEGPAWVVDPIDGTNNYVRGLRSWATSVAATVDGEVVAGATVCPALDDTYCLASGTARRGSEELSVSDRSDPRTFTVAPSVWWPPDRREEYAAACREIVDRFGDMRRLGSTQVELALCAAGGLDAVVTNVGTNPWDTLVGVGLVEAAGGVVTDVHGEPWRHDRRGLVASNGAAHEVVLEAARAPEAVR